MFTINEHIIYLTKVCKANVKTLNCMGCKEGFYLNFSHDKDQKVLSKPSGKFLNEGLAGVWKWSGILDLLNVCEFEFLALGTCVPILWTNSRNKNDE